MHWKNIEENNNNNNNNNNNFWFTNFSKCFISHIKMRWTSFGVKKLKWLQMTIREEKKSASPNIKNSWQKMFHHILQSIWYKYDSNFFNSMVNFVLCQNAFSFDYYQTHIRAMTFAPSCFLYIQLSHNIYIIVKNHTNSWSLKPKRKNKIGRNKKEIEYHE